MTSAEIAEKRQQELRGDQNFVESTQRKRTDFAETLRKDRANKDKQEKRKRMTNTTANVPGAGATPNAVGA